MNLALCIVTGVLGLAFVVGRVVKRLVPFTHLTPARTRLFSGDIRGGLDRLEAHLASRLRPVGK
jgi:hypothetical protein